MEAIEIGGQRLLSLFTAEAGGGDQMAAVVERQMMPSVGLSDARQPQLHSVAAQTLQVEDMAVPC